MDLIKEYGNNVNPVGISYTDGTVPVTPETDFATKLAQNAKGNYGLFADDYNVGFNLNQVDNKKLNAYIDLGGAPSKHINNENIDKLLADKQSAFDKWKNAIGQTLVSEIGLGTLKGASDLIDFIGQTIGVSDGDYSNPVSQALEKAQEDFKAWAPIYVEPDKNIANGGLLDAGWWASNMPSIASSLTLLLPAMAGTKVMSSIGKLKLFGTEKSLGQFTRSGILRASRGAERIGANNLSSWLASDKAMIQGNLFLENGMTAALSRTMENYQESRQTYNDMYDEVKSSFNDMKPEDYASFIARNKDFLDSKGIDVNDKDAVAKAIAKESADRTFALDWANVVFDVYQMYALRNIFSHSSKFKMSPKARKEQRESILYAGMTAEEKAAAKAARSKLDKTLDFVGDYTIGGANMIKASASEGVEEAINYIAQQEGTHLGKYLLTGEGDDKVGNFFDAYTRNGMYSRIIQDYIKEPSLWDSAFWGVLGGVVFEGLGSGFKRIEQTAKRKSEDKARERNEKTEEQIKKPNWWELDELPETKRMVSDIQARDLRLQMFSSKMKEILENHTNPYDPNAVKGALSDQEAQVLAEQAKNEYINELVMNARNNGTLDMLYEYLGADNVRNAFVKLGITNDTNSVKDQQDILNRAKRINDMYDAELTHVSNIAADIHRKNNTSLPIEYLQIIASNNVNHRLGIETLNTMKSKYQEEVNRIEGLLKDHTKSLMGYKELVKLQQITRTLAELNAEKHRLEKDAKTSIDARQSLDYINRQIATLTKEAFDASTSANLARLLYANSIASNTYFSEDGKSFELSDNALLDTISEINDGNLEKLIPEGIEFDKNKINTEALLNEIKKIDKDLSDVIGDENKLAAIDPTLPINYATLAAIDHQIALHNMDLTLTQDEVMSYINFAHNTITEARRKAIRDASDKLIDIQRRNKDAEIHQIIDTIFDTEDKFNEAAKNLSEEDKQSLKEAIEVLNLANGTNKKLYENIKEGLFFARLAANQETQSSSGNQNQSQAAQPAQSNNISQTASQTATTQGTQQNQPQQSQQQQTKHTIGRAGIIVNSVREILISDDKTNGILVTAVPSEDETYELDIKRSQELGIDTKNLEKNTDLFDIRHQPIDGGVITKNPIIKNNEGEVEVISKGVIENPASVGANQSTSPTGVVESNPPAPASATPSPAPVEPVEPTAVSMDDTINQLFTSAREYVGKVKNNISISYNDFKETIQDIINSSEDPEEAERRAKVAYDSFAKRAKRKYASLVEDEYTSAVTENEERVNTLVDEVNSDITEERTINNKTTKKFKKSFEDALEAVVKDFIKANDIKKIDGKYLINLENLLRYTNGFDGFNARLLFDNLKEYLNSKAGQDKYVVTDRNNFNDPSFLSNVNKTLVERLEDGINNIDHRINISEIGETGLKELDNCEVGDKLTITKGFGRIKFYHNGVNIGYIGIPTIVGKDTYKSENMGWIYDIQSNGTNNVISAIRDAITKIALQEDSDCKEINAVITEFAFTKPSKERTDELMNILSSNKYWNEMVSKFGADNHGDDERIMGLAALWRYKQSFQDSSTSIGRNAIKRSIDGWFSNILNEYATAHELAKQNNPEITIGTINEGALIRVQDRVNLDETEQLPLVNEGVSNKYKGKISLAVGHAIQQNEPDRSSRLTVVANSAANIPTIIPFISGANNTFVVVPRKNGKHGFVQAFGTKLKGIQSQQVKEIIDAINSRIDYLVDESIDSLNGNISGIEDFLDNLFNYSDASKVNLLYGGIFSRNNYGGVNLYKKGNQPKLDTFPANGNIRIGKEIIHVDELNRENLKKQLKDFINQYASFNLSERLIQSDNNTQMPLAANGFFSRTSDGKFTITIPGTSKVFTFNSYNDFVIENDLIRVNTKPDANGNNFTRNPNNQAGNPSIRYKTTISSPVGESTISGQSAQTSTSDYTKNDKKAINIINDSDISNKGEAIARLVLDDEAMKPLVRLGLLPSNIIYDENFNTGVNRGNINASTVIAGPNFGRVKIGPKLLKMLSSSEDYNRKQAVRKLIHERLHAILHSPGNEHFINDIKEIYDEFVKYNQDTEASSQYTKYEFKNNPDALEEFLVESLTSKELAEYLNNITTEEKINMRVSKRDTLLNKIFRVLAKLMGVKIKNNTLYAKEFEALRNAINSTPQQLELFNEETVTKEEEIEQESTPTVEEEDDTDDILGQYDDLESSVTEEGYKTSSISDYINSLPFERQAIVAKKISTGEISIKCK